MITIQSKDGQVVLKLTSWIPYAGDWTYTFNWNCNSKDYAGLLVERFNTTIHEHLQYIRQTAYEQGWKDAKAKKKKEAWFSGAW